MYAFKYLAGLLHSRRRTLTRQFDRLGECRTEVELDRDRLNWIVNVTGVQSDHRRSDVPRTVSTPGSFSDTP